MSSVLIMAGGTGGHVYPGLAVAEALRSKGIEVIWMGTSKGIESRLVPEAGFELDLIRISGLKGRGPMAWLLLPFRLLLALIQSAQILWRRRPSMVLSMGGFVAGPGGIMSWLMRRPLVVHEQNAIPGLTNKILSLFSCRILTGFPGVLNQPKAIHTGNPVRREICKLSLNNSLHDDASDSLHVLVIGGSQGARSLNHVVADMMHYWTKETAPTIWHQCGNGWLNETLHRYGRKISEKNRIVSYIEDMQEAYAWSDLVVCRAGAMTIAELACAGRASILVPFPFAADNHQFANAKFLADRDAAILLPEEELNPERLYELLHELNQNREVISRMRKNAHACAMPDADELVTRACLEAMHA